MTASSRSHIISASCVTVERVLFGTLGYTSLRLSSGSKTIVHKQYISWHISVSTSHLPLSIDNPVTPKTKAIRVSRLVKRQVHLTWVVTSILVAKAKYRGPKIFLTSDKAIERTKQVAETVRTLNVNPTFAPRRIELVHVLDIQDVAFDIFLYQHSNKLFVMAYHFLSP